MDRKILKALSLISQLGISMVVPIGMCLFIGKLLDSALDTSPLFIIIFILLGIGGGFRSVYMIIKPYFSGQDTYIDINKYKGKGHK